MPEQEDFFEDIREFLANTDPGNEQDRGMIGEEAQKRSYKKNSTEGDRRFIDFANEINGTSTPYYQMFPIFGFNFWSIFRRKK